MLTIPDYTITDKIHEGRKTNIYTGYRNADRRPAAFKLLKDPYPSLLDIAKLKYEHDIAKAAEGDGVIQVCGMAQYENTPVLILEHFGLSLKEYLRSHKLGLQQAVELAIRLAEILSHIHSKGIVHKDLNPNNILIDPGTSALKVIDFEISTLLSSEAGAMEHNGRLEGTLSYISPEQTGRMRRLLDNRSDFYSLGVTCYELFTGILPFQAEDEMELVHCHLAREPVPAHHVNKAVPAALSAIIAKLMDKKAENRYQSADGLIYDLTCCLEASHDFQTGTRDFSATFQIPHRIYGREEELEAVMSSFDYVSQGGNELFCLTGGSGMGKSFLLNEIHHAMAKENAYYISGKYEQLKTGIPYYAVFSAFKELISQILTESEERLAYWKSKLSGALGANGKIMTDVLPELAIIIGQQPDVPGLPLMEAQNRFNLVFQNFIKAFTSKGHPLVLALDDLQWADLPSLKLIETLLSDSSIKYLMILIAYRDDEPLPSLTVAAMLDRLLGKRQKHAHRELQPLKPEYIDQLLSDALKSETVRIQSLSELCLRKTGGNPFHLNQYLYELSRQRLVYFDKVQQKWSWQIDKIEKTSATEYMADLVAKKIGGLSPEAQSILKTAACLGSRFELKTLANVSSNSTAHTAALLWEPIKTGVIVPLNDDYRLAVELQDADVGYRFFHDKVQQALYAAMTGKGRMAVHLKTGRILLNQAGGTEADRQLFSTVNHLNLGQPLIESRAELLRLAQLNLEAGLKAKATAAFDTALGYFKAGLAVLDESAWDSSYDLMLSLHAEACESAYITTDSNYMEQLVDAALKRTRHQLDMMKFYEIRILSYIAGNRLLEAVDTALHALRLLHYAFPSKPGKPRVALELAGVNLILAGKDTEALLSLPPMTDPRMLSIMRILASAGIAAYSAVPDLLPVFTFRSIGISLRYGNAPESSMTYIAYGLILCCVLGDIEGGYSFGRLGVRLVEATNARGALPNAYHLFAALILHWKQPFREAYKVFLDAYRIGLETGDIESASYALHNHCSTSFLAGEPLSRLEQKLTASSQTISRLKQSAPLFLNELYHQAVKNLTLPGSSPSRLVGDSYDEDKMLIQHMQANDTNLLFNLYFNKLMLGLIMGEWEEAYQYAAEAEKHLHGVLGTIAYPVFHFYSTLVWTARYTGSDSQKRQQLTRKIKKNIKLMKKWSFHAPDNFLNKYYLMQAELNRITDRELEAMAYYDKAVEAARQQGFVQEEALANELASRFYFDSNKNKAARAYLCDAYFCYGKWGAAAKTHMMALQYSEILSSGFAAAHASYTASSSASGTTPSALDITTIIKASQAISGEIELEPLVKKLVGILFENAGAQKVVLILKGEAGYQIEAEGFAEDKIRIATKPVPLYGSGKLPESIINYVLRTGEAVVLDDACKADTDAVRFIGDRYIEEYRPRSILCLPIISKGDLAGIAYMENNSISGAFTTDRLEVLNILAAQLAISMENAALYRNLRLSKENLEEQVYERTLKLTDANKRLEQTSANIKSLLNNAGQGFLSFDFRLQVDNEYSSECKRVFQRDIEGAYFPELLFSHDPEQKDLLEQVLKQIFIEKELLRRHVYLTLLPGEAVVSDHYLQVDYKLLDQIQGAASDKIMVILTDITGKYQLEKRMEEEKSILKMVVKAVVSYNDLTETIKDYQQFCLQKSKEILESSLSVEEKLYEFFRNVHNFKGNFSQLDMFNIVERLHQFETALSVFKDKTPQLSLEDLKRFLDAYGMADWLETDLRILKEILGERFFLSENTRYVDTAKLMEIEKKMAAILSPIECGILLPQLRALRHKPFKELLSSYPEYVARLSERLEKPLTPMVIDGGDFLVDTDKYAAFTRTLVHVFRNALDHGIETPDDRFMAGKSENATVSCSISLEGGQLRIKIADDGRGVDIERIRRIAADKGMLSETGIENSQDSELLQLIFRDELTTRTSVSELSGRGIGLSAVKKELDALGGTVTVTTAAYKGTSFDFFLPCFRLPEVFAIPVEEFMALLLSTSATFLESTLGFRLQHSGLPAMERDRLQLHPISVFISLRGILSGKIILSADNAFGEAVLKSFAADESAIAADLRRDYVEDVLGECLNTILGNLMHHLREFDNYILIEPPVVISSAEASLKHMQSEIWTMDVGNEAGKLSLSFVTQKYGE